MTETKLVDNGSNAVRETVRNRVAVWPGVRVGIGIGTDVWEGECLDNLNLADITMDQVGAVEYEEMALRKVHLDEMG